MIFSFNHQALGQAQTTDQLRTPAKGSPERKAILDAVREEYKEGEDRPAEFQVNYLKVHQGWAWIDVTPLNESGKPVADPAPLLFYNDNGKWMAKDLNDVPTVGDDDPGPHDPSPKYIKALQKNTRDFHLILSRRSVSEALDPSLAIS
jgi:hypothetical protein